MSKKALVAKHEKDRHACSHVFWQPIDGDTIRVLYYDKIPDKPYRVWIEKEGDDRAEFHKQRCKDMCMSFSRVIYIPIPVIINAIRTIFHRRCHFRATAITKASAITGKIIIDSEATTIIIKSSMTRRIKDIA